MAGHDMILLKEDTRRIRLLAQKEGVGDMTQSGMIFGNRKLL